MKKKMKFTSLTIIALAISLLGFINSGYCEENTTALMMQMSPVEGGTLNISTGVHIYDRDSEIKLNAVPKPGYTFVCWQGGVSEASSSSTSILLDSPKIVIAVFERSKFEVLDKTEAMQVLSGGGGLIGSRSSLDSGLEQATGGQRPGGGSHFPGLPHNVPVPGKEGNGTNVPVPSGNDNNPVPEPTTIALLGAGIMLISSFKRKCNNK